MADLKKVIKAEDIDAALANIEKSFSESKVTLIKSVDKRAMGGDQKEEAGNEVISAAGDDRKGLPKVGAGTRDVSKLEGNFATRYPMDTDKAEGSGLEEAVKDSAKAPTRDKKVVNKSVEESAEPSKIEKAADQSDESSKIVKAADASSSSSSSKKVEKAVNSSASSMSKAVDNSSATSSKKNPFVKKAVVPAEQSAAKTAESGAPQLKKSMKLIASANKHLAKAYEGGSDSELETAGNRLVEAKTSILKSIEAGEKVPADLIKSLDKAANYFGKALASFENDKIEEHVKAVEKSQKHMLKAIDAYELHKSIVEKEISKSVTTSEEIKFNHKDGKVTAEMTEAQFKQVEKALTKDGVYKSFLDTLPKQEKATIDAMPLLKSLVEGLKDSQNALRDNLTAKADNDNEFKKSVSEALTLIGKTAKQTAADLEALKDVPKVRKSILTEVKSPLADEQKPKFEISNISDILIKGMNKGICSRNTVLAWDVDKDLPDYHQKYFDLCEKIQRS